MAKILAWWPLAALALGLFGAFTLLSLQAVGLWELGPFDPLVRWLYRLSEVALIPFTLVARVVFPPQDHHHVTGFFLSRAILAALFYTFVFRLAFRHFTSAASPHPFFAQRTYSTLPRKIGGSPCADSACPRPRYGKMAKRESRWLWRFSGSRAAEDEGRRSLLLGGLTLAAGASLLGLCGWVTGVVPARIRLRTYRVAIRNLPPQLDGFKIAHLSDTHLGPFISADHILAAIALANATEPDLTVLTGDYVHRTPRSIVPGIAVFRHLQARLGVVAVLGNHDHWEGAEECRRQFARLSIPLIDNGRVFVTPESLSAREISGQSLAVGGVGDLWEDTVDLRAALLGVSPTCPRILLAHNPDFAELAAGFSQELHVDLQISGHTHGGQVMLPGAGALVVPSRHGDKYAGGLVEGPRWPVIVSRGVGMAVLPVRFGVDPEVGLIELTNTSS